MLFSMKFLPNLPCLPPHLPPARMTTCCTCRTVRAVVKRPKDGSAVCRECFFSLFESEIHTTIVDNSLFSRGDTVAIGASGGKDSTVLAYVLRLLNERHDYGLNLLLLSIDEGITGYRDDSLEAVKRHSKQYGMEVTILSYEQLYGWTMDKVVSKIGKKNNCTYCGVFRRQALDRGAMQLNVDKLATGHNADDIAETVLMNMLRGDIARLRRCTQIVTDAGNDMLPRCKPLKYAYEKEIVMYAHFKGLDYFSTECRYAPNAYRGHVRSYIKDIEQTQPRAILDIINSGEALAIDDAVNMPTQTTCKRCGYMSSQPLCKACLMLDGLNTDQLHLGVRKAPLHLRKIEDATKSLSVQSATQTKEGCDDKSSDHMCACGDNNKRTTPSSIDMQRVQF